MALDFPYATRWRGRVFHYVRCGACGSTYVDPLPSDDELEELYSDEHYHKEHYPSSAPSDSHVSSVELLREHAGGRRRLLDFGCGSGGFLTAASRAGFDAWGIEFHPNVCAQTSAATGLPVKLLEEVRAENPGFEIIHLGDVFEHLPAPQATLRTLQGLLRPGGLFFVEGPLEANPSLVRFAAKAAKMAGRAIGRNLVASHSPLHLVMTRRKAQEEFFTRRLGMTRRHFSVSENGWPYREGGRAPGAVIKRAVADAAVAASWIRVGGEPIFGNRFAGIFEV